MKKRLTVNVDAEVIPAAKRYARDRGVSLSSLVERSLRELAADRAELAGVEGDKQRDGERGNGDDSRGRIGDQEPDEFAKVWAARWRAWRSGEQPPPPRSNHPRYRYLDEATGGRHGVRWDDDDQPIDWGVPPGLDDGAGARKRAPRPLEPNEDAAAREASLYERWRAWQKSELRLPPPDPNSGPFAEYKARKRGLDELEPARPNEGGTTWAERWRGSLKGSRPPPAPGEDPRYDYLAEKYGLRETGEVHSEESEARDAD